MEAAPLGVIHRDSAVPVELAEFLGSGGPVLSRRYIPGAEIRRAIWSWHSRVSIRRISLDLGIARKTVQKYVGVARDMGVERGALMPLLGPIVTAIRKGSPTDLSKLPRGPVQIQLEPHLDWIREKLQQPGVCGKDVWAALREERHCDVSYLSVKRYIRNRIQDSEWDITRASSVYETLIRLPAPSAIRWIARLLDSSGDRRPHAARFSTGLRRSVSMLTQTDVERREHIRWMEQASRDELDAHELTSLLEDPSHAH